MRCKGQHLRCAHWSRPVALAVAAVLMQPALAQERVGGDMAEAAFPSHDRVSSAFPSLLRRAAQAKQAAPGVLAGVGKDLETFQTYAFEVQRSSPDLPTAGLLGQEHAQAPVDVDVGQGLQADPRVTPTPPQRLQDARQLPYRAVYKLIIRSGNKFFSCSATPLGDYHLATAGSCLYVRDSDFDLPLGWVDRVWAIPAATNMIFPRGNLEQPFGEAVSTQLRSWKCWTEQGNPGCDFGIVTLDRRLPTRTGRFGWNGATPPQLRFSGYPVDRRYIQQLDSLFQFSGYDPGNVRSYQDTHIVMDAITYGGHNGGPAWDDGARNLTGVLSHINPAGLSRATRVTQDEIDLFQQALADDNQVRPPKNLSDLKEEHYHIENTPKALHTPSTTPGGQVRFRYNVFNAGFANSGPITVNFYLSTDYDVTTSDLKVGSATLPALAANNYRIVEHELRLPASVAPGEYLLGWIMAGTQPEYPGADYCGDQPGRPGCNNYGQVGILQVRSGGGGGNSLIFRDGFE